MSQGLRVCKLLCVQQNMQRELRPWLQHAMELVLL
jgi:hypothetical protein